MRRQSVLDEMFGLAGRALNTVAGAQQARRPLPTSPIAPGVAQGVAPDARSISTETTAQRQRSIQLMRVNQVGEVCAQALYEGQALATANLTLQAQFRRAAQEEADHLAWTNERLKELGGRTSLLNPLWYAGSLLLGLTAGRRGDAVSLGFMAETERQVEQHLDGHLAQLPAGDQRSRAILEQMKRDEAEHGEQARAAGAVDLPAPVRGAMRAVSKIMTTTARYI